MDDINFDGLPAVGSTWPSRERESSQEGRPGSHPRKGVTVNPEEDPPSGAAENADEETVIFDSFA